MDSLDTLLVEFGTEDLPPLELTALGTGFAEQLSAALDKAGFPHQSYRAFYTPRRLAVQLFQIAARQENQTIRRLGPALAHAYDQQGKPTKAALGFAKACGTTVEQLERYQERNEERLACTVQQRGVSLAQTLTEILPQVIQALPMKRRMRWKEQIPAFVRPIRRLCVLHAEQVLDCEAFGITAGRLTHAHRYHYPETVALQHAKDYESVLKDGKVIADFDQRCQIIEQQINERAGKTVVDMDEQSLAMAAAMTEWPQLVGGGFDPKFLSLPEPVLILILKNTLKMFPVLDQSGHLLPQFYVVADVESTAPETIQQGYEQVVQARLVDALFFLNQDKRTAFADRSKLLHTVVFQEQLGTLADKVERIRQLADKVSDICGAEREHVAKAAYLCKCDLMTDMVGEYPDLEGTMGQHYIVDGNVADEMVAVAVGEHYQPRYSGDALPTSPAGMALALADKVDTLTGIFSINRPPSGTKDPFGLRRAALGIVRILIEKEIPLDLNQLIKESLALHSRSDDHAACAREVLAFLQERIRVYCLNQGFSYDCIDAVMAVCPTKPLDFMWRLQAVNQFAQMPEAKDLSAANKRIANIFNKSASDFGELKAELLTENAEKALLTSLEQCEKTVVSLIDQAQYLEAIRQLAKLRNPVDRFFDEVLVMAEDITQRDNRLSLLARISSLFMRIADISKLALDKGE